MKRRIIFSLCWFIPYIAFAQTPACDPHWQLKWEDNFNSFDNLKWGKMNHGIHNSAEPQLYLESQVWISNGNLVLALNNYSAICDTNQFSQYWSCIQCTTQWQTHKYRSGWVETKDAYATKYGYIEARIKFPYKAGTQWGYFPAFWTWRANITNYHNMAEIDICEIFGGKYKDNTISTGVYRHYASPVDNWGGLLYFSNFSYADWHTYAIEWDKSRITWYLDGKAINSVMKHAIVDPVRIILNLAVEKEKKYHPPASPYFQAEMLVDYVKVHSLKCDKNTIVKDIPNFNTYDYTVKKYITMSDATTIPANSNISLRATDYIALKAGFYAPVGTNLYLDVSACDNSKIKLYKNYPDPFRTITNIKCIISEDVLGAKFFVYDSTSILVIERPITERGTVNIQVHAGELPHAGNYAYLLNADGELSDVMQMVLTDDPSTTVYQNYPNPFNNITKIECYIPQTIQESQLQIYNACGSLVKNIDILERGTISIKINADELPVTGIYTYLLTGDGQNIDTKQMILSKIETIE